MTRLVSSRIHRCYSRGGGQRSARNERLVDFIHLCACILLFVKGNISFFPLKSFSDFAGYTSELGGILLVVSNVADLFATLTAHRMFYKWSKSGKRRFSFLSTSTRVDAVISFLHTAGSILFALSTSSLSKTVDQTVLLFASVTSSFTIVLGSLTNVIASMPSLDYMVPAPMARAQNSVVSLFLMGSLTRLYATVIPASASNELKNAMQLNLQWLPLTADALMISGSILNLARVMFLVRKVQYWANDGTKSEKATPQRGLLSWFKSSRSHEGMSEYDSDLDDHGIESEDDGRNPSSSRRGGWSRI